MSGLSFPAASCTGTPRCSRVLRTNAEMSTVLLRTSRLTKILSWTIYFYGLIVVSDASFTCKAGQRVVNTAKKQCEECHEGYFQPTENDSKQCQGCTKCTLGSVQTFQCSTTRNTECRCRKGFLARVKDSSICKCDVGFGIEMEECHECKSGFFSSSFNSVCKAWTTCKGNKVRVNGTKTSDAFCHEPIDPLTPVPTTPRPKTVTTPLTTHTMSSPQEISTPTEFPHQKTTAPPTAVHYRRVHYVSIAELAVGVGLLVVIALAITCKGKEGQEFKRPIKETQQAKLHEIDIL